MGGEELGRVSLIRRHTKGKYSSMQTEDATE